MGFYGYGCYEARFRPISRPGVVTSFFTFAGPYDNGGNGRQIHWVPSTGTDPTPKAAESLHKIMMNVWPVDSTASGWAGTFVYPVSPLQAKYEWVRYDASPGCAFSFGAAPIT